jgi:hypothetical protein
MWRMRDSKTTEPISQSLRCAIGAHAMPFRGDRSLAANFQVSRKSLAAWDLAVSRLGIEFPRYQPRNATGLVLAGVIVS